MPRLCTICTHPDVATLNRAIVEGQSNRRIATQFSTTEAAVRRHGKDHLARLLAKTEPHPAVSMQSTHGAEPTQEPTQAPALRSQHLQREKTGDAQSFDLRAEIEFYRHRARKLADAVDEWLTDPDDPSRYDIGPRSHEITVVYEDLDDCSPAGTPKRKKATLAFLLDEIERRSGNLVPDRVQSKHADPRKLHLDTLAEQRHQLELLIALVEKIHGAQAIEAFNAAVLDAIAEVAPDVRDRIIDNLRRRQPVRDLARTGLG